MDSVFESISILSLVHTSICIAMEIATAPETRGSMHVDITSTAHPEQLDRDKPPVNVCAENRLSLRINSMLLDFREDVTISDGESREFYLGKNILRRVLL